MPKQPCPTLKALSNIANRTFLELSLANPYGWKRPWHAMGP